MCIRRYSDPKFRRFSASPCLGVYHIFVYRIHYPPCDCENLHFQELAEQALDPSKSKFDRGSDQSSDDENSM